MFKEKYQKDNEKITADPAVRNYIKSKFKGEKTPSRRKIPVTAYVAAALSVCLAVGVIFVANGTKVPQPVVDENGLATNLTYNSIYNSINTLIKQNRPGPFEYLTEGIIGGFNDMAKGEDNLWIEDGTAIEESEDINGSATGSGTDSSTTNNQVAGVDEADIVKNDGKYIYVLSKGSITIADSNNGNPKFVSKIDVTAYEELASEFYVKNNRLAVVVSSHSVKADTVLKIFNIEDKNNPTLMSELTQSGYATNSRLVGDTIYLLSTYSVYNNDIKKDQPETFVPCVGEKPVPAEDITLINDLSVASYLVITANSLTDAKSTSAESVLGGAENLYCNTEHLYYTFTKGKQEKKDNKTTYISTTTIVKMALSPDNITLVADGVVNGTPLNQFSMDEYKGNLRIVTTEDRTVTIDNSAESKALDDVATGYSGKANNLFVLDENLKLVGSITGLAENERVYSVRFDGEIGYFVTFRQVDPLFTVDLSNPAAPRVLGELKIPGFSEYLHPFGDGLLFGFGKSATDSGLVKGLKLSMFDVSDPSNVTEKDITPIAAAWSEASNNHKAIMVDKDKNIIAFAANDDYGRARAYIFGYSPKKGFYERAELIMSEMDSFSARFLWIGNHFYISTDSTIHAYSMDIFAPTGTMDIY